MSVEVNSSSYYVKRSHDFVQSSTLMSAHELYAAITGHLPRPAVPTILEQVRPDGAGHVDAAATGKLFHRLWQLSGRFKGLDLELDMSLVCSVAPRFVRELSFLRNHVRQRVVLSNVRLECAWLLDLRQPH